MFSLSAPSLRAQLTPKGMQARIEAFFHFALVWSLGAAIDDEGRKKFDALFKATCNEFGRDIKVTCHRDVWWGGQREMAGSQS
jgi:hypothetical protein